MFWPQSTFFNSTLIFFLSSIACIFPFPPTVRIFQFLAVHMAIWKKDHIHQLHLHLSVLNQKDSSKWCVSYFFEVPPIFFRPNRLQMFQPEVNQLQDIAWWSHTQKITGSWDIRSVNLWGLCKGLLTSGCVLPERDVSFFMTSVILGFFHDSTQMHILTNIAIRRWWAKLENIRFVLGLLDIHHFLLQERILKHVDLNTTFKYFIARKVGAGGEQGKVRFKMPNY